MMGSMQISFVETAQGELDGAIEYYNRRGATALEMSFRLKALH